MAFKIGLLLATLLVGSLALPTDSNEDLFIHADPNARIVGGSPAAEGSVPYMAALYSGLIIRSFSCGASLVTTTHVLTAAHCIDGLYSFGSVSSTLRVIVGTNRHNLGGQVYTVSRNISHPNYVSSTIKNDIAFLVVAGEVALSRTVQLVPLSFANIGEGVLSRAAGWGRIRQNGALASTLLELYVHTVSGQRCQEEIIRLGADMTFTVPPVEPALELCTFHSPGHGMCNGDSGSALVDTRDGRQIGIVSWGLPCARGAPDMFVRISAYRSWIEQSLAQ